MRKTMPKNISKNLEIKQKTRHDPTPKNRDSQISSAKAVPPKHRFYLRKTVSFEDLVL